MIKRILSFGLILGLISLACSIPNFISSNIPDPDVTQIVITATLQDFSSTLVAGQSQPGGSRPTPTSIPTKPAPTQKGAGPQFVSALSISNVSTSPGNTVYYGNCGPGDITQIHVEATVDPLNKIKEVLLWFDIYDNFGPIHSDFVNMFQLGIGDYAGDIDVGQIGPNTLVNEDGEISFWIEAVDKDSTSIWSNTYSLTIWNCLPLPPPSINTFTNNGPVTVGETITLEWETTIATCGVYYEGKLVDPVGNTKYQTVLSDSPGITKELIAFGGDCNTVDPPNVKETTYVTVNAAQTTNTVIGIGSIVYDEASMDLGDGFVDDVFFDIHSGGIDLFSSVGPTLKVWNGGEHSVNGCKTYLSSGGNFRVSIEIGDVVCYQTTHSFSYGFLTIDGMFIDLDDYSNSYVVISHRTDVNLNPIP